VDHEDWRYANIRAKVGAFYWPISLLSFHLTPTAVVFLGLSPLYGLLSGRVGGPVLVNDSRLFAASAVVAAGAIALQTVADNQLAHFRKNRTQGAVLESGVWAYSRHPNYFGEFLFWAGVLGMGLTAGVERWMCASVPVIFSFFRFASVPLMDERMLQRRPEYAATTRRVSAFVPWFRAGGR
jgi:steroid 5-alpha reductase family enzyme